MMIAPGMLRTVILLVKEKFTPLIKRTIKFNLYTWSKKRFFVDLVFDIFSIAIVVSNYLPILIKGPFSYLCKHFKFKLPL